MCIRDRLFLVGAVMALSMFAQKLTSVRSFEYLDYVTPHPYDAVSYTHLDVYKRQLLYY